MAAKTGAIRYDTIRYNTVRYCCMAVRYGSVVWRWKGTEVCSVDPHKPTQYLAVWRRLVQRSPSISRPVKTTGRPRRVWCVAARCRRILDSDHARLIRIGAQRSRGARHPGRSRTSASMRAMYRAKDERTAAAAAVVSKGSSEDDGSEDVEPSSSLRLDVFAAVAIASVVAPHGRRCCGPFVLRPMQRLERRRLRPG